MTGQQLKNSILQMAVQGKLVPQDPNDEPASVLLERIRKEKEQLIKEGKIKKEKNPSYIFRGADNLPYEKVGKNEPVCIADEVPFEIPDSWEWAKIKTISMPIGNKNNQIQSKEALPTGKIPVVSQGKDLIDGYCNDVSKKIDVLPLVMFGDHTRNVKYIDFEFVIGADGTKFHKILSCNPEYIYYWMLYAAETLRNRGYARHYTLLKECFIPLPPLQEQVRIVSKIKAILPLVEKYSCEEIKRVSLDSAFPNLLKKSILQEAIQGKLVPQDPGDEPASVLLERIRAEKDQLIKAGKIKRDKHESVIFRRDNSHYEKLDGIERCIDAEIPFDIPDSWVWTTIGEVCTNIQYGSSKKSSSTGKIAVLRMGNLQNGRIVLDKLVYTSDSKEIEKYPLEYKDLLFNRTNSKELVGKVAIYKSEIPAIYAGYLVRLQPILIDSDYLNYVMQSQYYWIYCQNVRSDAIGQSNINAEKLKRFIFPLPPLQEQKRIVNQISCAMSKIEHL